MQTSGKKTPDELLAALFRVQDVLDRALIPFVLLGHTAYQVKHNIPLDVNKIYIGVLRRHAVKECTDLIKVIDPKIELYTDGYRLVHNQIPVIIKIIEKEYPVLMNPDIVFYMYDTFRVPNPFDKYWEGPHLDI